MKRKIINALLTWKDSKNRKPLILKGARQTGKTYILKAFSIKHFKQMHYFNFESDTSLLKIFEKSLHPKYLLEELSLYSNKTINTERDIIIFDEIQECPRALTSLKYFNEEMPKLAICCAGSHMGLVFSKDSFPVGKVDFLSLFPMSFEEFLMADPQINLLKKFLEIKNKNEVSSIAHELLVKAFKNYLIVGGLPEVVKYFYTLEKIDLISFAEIRKIQNNLINSYISDFTKHAGKFNSLHILSTFQAISKQIASTMNGNLNRFKFKDVLKGKKSFRELQGPIEWLKASGLIIQVFIVNRAENPLYSFSKENQFKLYIFDIGLLGAILSLSLKDLSLFNFGIEKGAFTENFVAQELLAQDKQNKLYAWSENTSELEFLRLIDDLIVPVEVKSSQHFRARSLEFYIKRYSPKVAHIISLNEADFSNPKVLKLPLYCPILDS